METENLVVLKGTEPVYMNTGVVKPNHFYRHIELSEGKRKEHLVFGFVFSDKEFNDLFELAHTRVLRDFKAIGILPESGKPISKSAFTKLADIREYGKLRVWYFRNSRERIYGFYPMQGNKIENAIECYRWYLDLINGKMDSLDDGDVKFGNCGIPLAYGGLRVI